MSVPAATATHAPPVPVLKDIIWERFTKSLDIKRRLHVVRAFSDELDRVKRGKRFSIRNGIVWRAMLDVRDKLVIDLCSLTVEMRHGMKPLDPKVAKRTFRGGLKRKRGLFVEIRDHHRASLTRTHVPCDGDDEDDVAMDTESKAETFARLFPKCTGDTPSEADVEQLCEDFRLRTVDLQEDRHKNRAHALEGEVGTAKMLWVPEFEALFGYVEQVLEDLSLVSAGPSFGGDDMNDACCEETARDTVDLVLLGSISDVRQLTEERTRDELYDLLHQIHDADEPAEPDDVPELHFNDRQFMPPFVDWRSVRAAR
jgi:hypothetical protein